MSDQAPPRCTWCDKPALLNLKGPDGAMLPTCPDHYIGLQGVENERQRILNDQARHAMAMANHAMAEMDAISGFNVGPKISIPAATPAGNYASINISNSTIGAVSTAAVGQISAYIGHMPQSEAARSALQEFTAAVANAQMDEDERKNLLDQITVVAEQAATKPDKRKPAVLLPILTSIGQAAGAVNALAVLWKTIEPILKAHFHLP